LLSLTASLTRAKKKINDLKMNDFRGDFIEPSHCEKGENVKNSATFIIPNFIEILTPLSKIKSKKKNFII
jgi:hypothetical protein